jgi:hypothetical protein
MTIWSLVKARCRLKINARVQKAAINGGNQRRLEINTGLRDSQNR